MPARWTYGEIKDLSDRIARLLVEEEGLVPGNRVLPARAQWRDAVRRLARHPQGGRHRRRDHADPPPRRDRDDPRARRRSATRSSTAASSAISARARRRPARSARCSRYDGDSGAGELETRLKTVAPGFAPVDTHRDDVALIAFTSGTTGKPKGCVHYHRDILAPADAFARHILKPQPGDRWACSAPIAFTFGLGQLLIFPFRFRGCAVTIEMPSPAALLDAIGRHKVTTLATAPTAYKAMLTQLEGRDISTPAHLRLGGRASARGDLGGLEATRPASRSSTASARPR